MKKLLYIWMLLAPIPLFAQQNAQYNQYIFNQLVINPAYAGSKGMVNINGIFGSQWSGLDGAPTSSSISVEGPLNSSMGLGLHLIQDNLGAQSQTGVYGSYAYKIRLSAYWRLSLGISMGASYFTLDGTQLDSETENDPSVPLNKETITRFDSKMGAFLFGRKFYAGFSVSDLTADVMSNIDLLVAGQVRHYYLTAGYVLDVAPDLKFKPGFLIKEDFRAPTSLDLNGFLLYKNKVWIGGTFRTGMNVFKAKDLEESLRSRNALVFMTELNVTDNFRVGYAYTHTMTALRDYSGHEFHLGYYFKPKLRTKMLTPRYF